MLSRQLEKKKNICDSILLLLLTPGRGTMLHDGLAGCHCRPQILAPEVQQTACQVGMSVLVCRSLPEVVFSTDYEVRSTNKRPNQVAHCEFAVTARIPAPIAPPKTKKPPAPTSPADEEARAIARTASAREYQQHQSGLPSRIIPRIQRKGGVSSRRLSRVLLDRRPGLRMRTGSISLWT